VVFFLSLTAIGLFAMGRPLSNTKAEARLSMPTAWIKIEVNRREEGTDSALLRPELIDTVELCCVLGLRETSTARPPG
jgi:hypothetical protein